jgi:hypothetical protein
MSDDSSRWLDVDRVSHQPIERNDPRSMLEASESDRPDMIDKAEVAAALGRILAWILDANSLKHIGARVKITAAKLRPDLINGQTLESIGREIGTGRTRIRNQLRDFEDIFGIRGINDRPDAARRAVSRSRRNSSRAITYISNYRRSNSHVCFVNRFSAWRRSYGTRPLSDLERQQFAADFREVIEFLDTIGLTHPPGKESIAGQVKQR